MALGLFGAAFVAPLLLAWTGNDGQTRHFTIAALIDLAVGLTLWGAGIRFRRELKPRDGFLLLALAWPLFAAMAALPFLFAVRGISYTQAYFEAVSGITTTGATALVGLDHLPRSLNLWRHELSWLGGLGLLGTAMAVLPLLGIGGMQFYRTDANGPIKESRLTPRFQQAARSLWLVYIGLTVLCVIALRLAGMGLFDAICHAMSTLSLGGFSTHDANIAYFDSPLIEIVLEFFMLAAGLNFTTHFIALRRRSLRPYAQDAEALAFFAAITLSAVAITLFLLVRQTYASPLAALRDAAFNVISLATDCGFRNRDYDAWPLFAPLWMLLLSSVVASAGSTGGGMKMIRTLILFRQSGREVASLVHPSGVQTLKVGDRVIPDRVVSSVLGFVHLYSLSVIVLTFLLIMSGLDLLSALSAVLATINNLGPGLRELGPGGNYSSLTHFQMWVCTASMLIGRVEVFVLLVPLTPIFWRE